MVVVTEMQHTIKKYCFVTSLLEGLHKAKRKTHCMQIHVVRINFTSQFNTDS